MSTSTLEVRHLELVAAIAEHRSVARAAETLNLSQPALSHALRALEHRLGVRLFERARRMTPTPAGAELQQASRDILTLVHHAEERVRRYRPGAVGVVRVATCCYTCYHWLPTVARSLRHASPPIALRVAPDVTADALHALANGEIDLALVHAKAPHRRIAYEKLFTDEQVLIVHPEHRLVRRRYVLAEDFRDERLLAHHPPETTAFWKQVLAPAGVRPIDAMALHSTEALLESV
jgi:LysR family transcriptional regulator for metE and metH